MPRRHTLVLLALIASVALLSPPHRPAEAQAVTPIGTIQGASITACRTQRSSFAPASPSNSAGTTVVRIQGVITQRTRTRTSSGGSNYGFFIQNTAATKDTDPNTSDGIFVFNGSFQTVRWLDGSTPPYNPQVGDEIVMQGRVSEFFNLTQLSAGLFVESVVRSGVNLDSEVPSFEVNPPDNLTDADCYWERREGMRARVPAGTKVVGGRVVFPSTADAEIWIIRSDHPVANRADSYGRRVYRDPHPLDNNPALFDDGNGFRILLGSLGIKWTINNAEAMLAPARTFDTVTSEVVGGIYFAFNKYSVMPVNQITLSPGPDPSAIGGVPAFDRTLAYSIATFNVENLYDYRDDPFDGCDFTGNSGCPGVNPPFDYVPASNAAYQQRLGEIADQIIANLRAPDIIMVQEVEDQDICAVSGSTLICGAVNNADGKPDTLQELAQVIAQHGGPGYDAAYDRDGADDRGIVSALLYRTDRVERLPADASHPVLGTSPTVQYRGTPLGSNTNVQNPKTLNAVLPADVDLSTGVDGSNVFTRAPQVGLFRVWRDQVGLSVFTDLYVISNHFSSTPTARVGQRREQAAYNAAIVAALQQADPSAHAVVGGDLNVYPRPDDPFVPGDTRYPSDQLGPLYAQGLANLYDRLLATNPVAAYSYVFEGQAQTLDQIFVTPVLLAETFDVHAVHVNSDFPGDYGGDGARGTSDHDPQAARLDALTLDGLTSLVRYLAATGSIKGQNVERILLHHLVQAARLRATGNLAGALAQLQAFVNQAQGLAPVQVSQVAANALRAEVALLVSTGF